jgi:hypothetical protein
MALVRCSLVRAVGMEWSQGRGLERPLVPPRGAGRGVGRPPRAASTSVMSGLPVG